MATGKRKRPTRRFTEVQKIEAVTAAKTIASSTGYPLGKQALEAVQAVLGFRIGTSVLRRWLVAYGSAIDEQMNNALTPAPLTPLAKSEVITTTHDNVIKRIERVRDKMLTRLEKDEVVDAMSGRDTGVVMGITNDHMLKMTGLPPEARAAMDKLRLACEGTGLDYVLMVEDMVARVTAAKHDRHYRALNDMSKD